MAEIEDRVLAWTAAALDELASGSLEAAIILGLEKRSLRPLERQSFVPFDPPPSVLEPRFAKQKK